MTKSTKTRNGNVLYKEDFQKAFSVAKTLLTSKGHHSNIVMTGVNTKEQAQEKLMELLDEYADNKYCATVERKFQIEEEGCKCGCKADEEEYDEDNLDFSYLFLKYLEEKAEKRRQMKRILTMIFNAFLFALAAYTAISCFR